MSVAHELGKVAAELACAWTQVLKYKVELEANSAKKWTAKVAGSIAGIFAALLVALAGIGFLIAGLFLLLTTIVQTWIAALIAGGAMLVLAVLILVIAKH